MTLLNIADMLADILRSEAVYAGNTDGNLDSCIGVYNAKNAEDQRICVGGKACTKTKEKHISILIHHTDNPTLAEERAEEILDKLSDIREYKAEHCKVHFLKCKNPVPIDRDERGICEYVIEATVYYESEE